MNVSTNQEAPVLQRGGSHVSSIINMKKKREEIVHHADGQEGITYCGHPFKIRHFPESKREPFRSAIRSRVTCKKCIKKLEESEAIDKKLLEYFKGIEKEAGDPDDNYTMGYLEAVSNLFGEFNNGHCEDCVFCFETAAEDFESGCMEGQLNCSLKQCWIDVAKEIIRGKPK